MDSKRKFNNEEAERQPISNKEIEQINTHTHTKKQVSKQANT